MSVQSQEIGFLIQVSGSAGLKQWLLDWLIDRQNILVALHFSGNFRKKYGHNWSNHIVKFHIWSFFSCIDYIVPMIGQVWILQPFPVIDFQILSLVFDGYLKILPIKFEWSEIKKYKKILGETYEGFKLQDIQNSSIYRCHSLISIQHYYASSLWFASRWLLRPSTIKKAFLQKLHSYGLKLRCTLFMWYSRDCFCSKSASHSLHINFFRWILFTWFFKYSDF